MRRRGLPREDELGEALVAANEEPQRLRRRVVVETRLGRLPRSDGKEPRRDVAMLGLADLGDVARSMRKVNDSLGSVAAVATFWAPRTSVAPSTWTLALTRLTPSGPGAIR